MGARTTKSAILPCCTHTNQSVTSKKLVRMYCTVEVVRSDMCPSTLAFTPGRPQITWPAYYARCTYIVSNVMLFRMVVVPSHGLCLYV
eukprot:24855-Eustigmatos_ZCMA.PRE.1